MQFDDDHVFTQALNEFERVAGECSGGSLTFDLHLNSELGLEKDYFENMSQGIAVDYAIVSPVAHVDLQPDGAADGHAVPVPRHRPLERGDGRGRARRRWPTDVLDKANVRLIGYAGGGTRQLIVNHPVTNMDELKGLPMRVMGAPIQTRIFEAIGAAPSVIAYDEVYNAIQTGVIDAAENEAAGIETDEVLRSRPRHLADPARDHRAPDRLLGSHLPAADARGAGLRAEGRQGRRRTRPRHGKLRRTTPSSMAMEDAGLLKTHEFTERDKLLELAAPVKRAYAEELGATDVLDAIEAVQ